MESLTDQIVTNMLSKRCLKILNLLEKKQIVQVKEIAEELKMSKRTILSDLNEIRSHFEDSVEISGSNRGIELIINDYSIYHFKKQVYIRQEPLIQIIEGIYSGECLNYVEWAEKISLSESTILRLLKKLKKIVKPYRINLSFSPVQFIGKELDARKFFGICTVSQVLLRFMKYQMGTKSS
ncbi:helix-turn-helix domain-containing protein [Enterococcus termitis]